MSGTLTNTAPSSDQRAERRHCSQCDGMMVLTSIGPGQPGFEIRNFECQDCRHVESHLAEIDAKQSGANGSAPAKGVPHGSSW